MSFDPSEPRGEHGRWIKLAQGLKKLSESDKGTVVKAMGELPKGGHGNRTSIKGIEIRRHQSGGVNVKIGGESRHYSSHEEAARAVISRQHAGEHAGAPKPVASVQHKAPGGKLGGSGHGPGGMSTGKVKGEMGKSDAQFKAEQDAKKIQNLKNEAAKLEDILAGKALSNKLKGKGAANDPATLKQESRLQDIYDQMAAYAQREKGSQMAQVAAHHEATASASAKTSRALPVDVLTKTEIHHEIAMMGGYEKAAKTTRGHALILQLQKV